MLKIKIKATNEDAKKVLKSGLVKLSKPGAKADKQEIQNGLR